MPQITVDYSSTMAPAFDRAGFARALHASVVEIAAAKPEACKTLFRPAEFTAFGYDDPEERGTPSCTSRWGCSPAAPTRPGRS